jgi:hypothetical protein
MVASTLDLSAAFSKFLALQGVARRGTSKRMSTNLARSSSAKCIHSSESSANN